MGNDFMGQILGSVLGGARLQQRPPMAGPGGLGEGLGGVLGSGPGGLAGGGRTGGHAAGRPPLGGNRGMLLALLLPLAMQWVQRNGGVGAVLHRLRQRGYGEQADSWVSTGPNRLLGPQAMAEVVGRDDLEALSRQLGVGEQEVAQGLAEVLPEVVDQVTPHGQVPPDADEVLNQGRLTLEEALGELRMH